MASKKDYYETLGLNKTASKDDIKAAYRKLAKKYHPDLNHEPGAEEKFKEVQEAYDILYDDEKRKMYDQYGSAAFEQGASTGGNPFQNGGFSSEGFGGMDFGDIFSSFFGGGSSRQSSRSSGPQRGDDSLMRIKISFMDAVNGKKVTFPIEYDAPCDACNGTGAQSASDIATCTQCNGSGYVRVRKQTIFGTMESQEVCPTCRGSGKVILHKCDKCGGKGFVRTKTNITVNIPAGINEGQQIRVQGKGNRGRNGGPNGDLYLEIIIQAHDQFKRDGNDIHLTIPISFIDAALGTKVDVPTVYGESTVEIPAGTQPGQILRMRGKGIADLRSKRPGDQYIHLDIKTPTKLNKKETELLNSFKSEYESSSDNLFEKFKRAFKK
jgi:molecular chaperone DnaJ